MPDDEEQIDGPVPGLTELEEDTSPAFLTILRRKIYRRGAASHLAAFGWHVPKVVAVELGNMLVQLLKTVSVRKRG